jgi:hypothetical protein
MGRLRRHVENGPDKGLDPLAAHFERGHNDLPEEAVEGLLKQKERKVP